MKKLLIATAVAAVTFSGAALADNTDNGTVNVRGEIIQTLSVSDFTIQMPDLVKPDDALSEPDTTVALVCDSNGDGTVSYTKNGSPFADGDKTANTGVVTGSANLLKTSSFNATGDCGEATVQGQGDAAYNFSVDVTASNTNNGVDLTSISCISQTGTVASATGDSVIPSAGTDTLHCGAAVSAGGQANAGTTYSLAGIITVTYD